MQQFKSQNSRYDFRICPLHCIPTWLMNFSGNIKIMATESVAAQQIELAKKVIAAYE